MALPARKLPTEPNWTRVSSSWIYALAYIPIPGSSYGTLCLWTHRKGVPDRKYGYSQVPKFVWQQMREASHGKAYWRTIRERYPEFRIG